MAAGDRWILIGNPKAEHIGASLRAAAVELGLDLRFMDLTAAFRGHPLVSKLNWWVAGHRPPRLRQFSRAVVDLCRAIRPQGLLATGIAPVDGQALERIGQTGVRRLNYLTDDPWNPGHRAPWFLKALPQYDQVFSPRRANLEDLRRAGVPSAAYLPFAYEPARHFPQQAADPGERARYDSEVLFYGGADPDRLRYILPLIRERFRLHLYGGYWDRCPAMRPYVRGYADARTIRLAVAGAKVCLGLVRRANRDGNSMRSFEIPAMGGCMLAEDTQEHREIFGPEGEAVSYFRTPVEMVAKLRWLLDRGEERRRLAQAAHRLVTQRRHTYRDRLQTMLGPA